MDMNDLINPYVGGAQFGQNKMMQKKLKND